MEFETSGTGGMEEVLRMQKTEANKEFAGLSEPIMPAGFQEKTDRPLFLTSF